MPPESTVRQFQAPRAAGQSARGAVVRHAASVSYLHGHGALRCLWISRDIPFPQDAGDRIYSANLARALAQVGAQVCFLGYGPDLAGRLPEPSSGAWPIETHALSGNKRGRLSALLSKLPIAAAIHATTDFKSLLRTRLAEPWDAVVIDSYGSGWALDECTTARTRAKEQGQTPPLLVYLSHNHEESIWQSMAEQSQASLPKRLAIRQNYRKVSMLERKLAKSVDLISAITSEDAELYRRAGAERTVTLTPGYSGRVTEERRIDQATPRRLVLVGSFRWVVKQENLRRFLQLADARFHEAGIGFDVIGDVPAELLAELKPGLRATTIHGFVDDIGPYFAAARMAVVPELIGGGFKLKYLDYLFNRVPIASISEAAAGLPQEIRDNMVCRDDLAQLVDAIIANMDDVPRLERMQAQAFEAARALFDWRDRGERLLGALKAAK